MVAVPEPVFIQGHGEQVRFFQPFQEVLATGSHYLDRIQRYDVDRLNSVIELNPQVLADAAAADAARGAGKLLGALHGIPVLFKDNIATGGGMHTTAGAYALKDWQPARDAFLVQQLRDAGALIFGKANLSESAQAGLVGQFPQRRVD